MNLNNDNETALEFLRGQLRRPVVLVGMMGVGKTHVGRKLADKLKLPFKDSDRIIEEKAGRPVTEIFEVYGEEKFRQAERNSILEILAGEPCILATGGGAVLNDETRKAIHSKAKIAVRTVARRLSALRQFYRFVVSENIRKDDPTSAIESPKQGRTLPKTLSETDVNILIKTAAAGGGPESVRLVALLEMLYATGLRVSELVGLPMSAIGQGYQFLIISGKAGRERMVPLSDPAQKAIKKYLDVRKQFVGSDEQKARQEKWVFPSRTSDSGHLTRQRFAQLLKDLARAAGLEEGKVSPHILRHAFATHLLSNGADLRSVQKMLGHADIATTQIYTHIVGDKLKKTVKDKHPLSKTGTDE
jgi:integrase/recombinase XerD